MMDKGKSVILRLLTLVVVFALAGCAGDQDDLNRYIADVKSRPPTPIDPIPPVRTYTPYEYQGLLGRNPFRRSTSEGSDQVANNSSGTGPRPDLQRPKEYLERFELDTLEMVGTFTKSANEWALIRDPDGVVHRVSVGNYIGKNYGRVLGIQADEVALSEFIANGAGGWLVREAEIALGGG